MPSEDRPKQIDGVDVADVYLYLDGLRESGEINMYGAGPYLQEDFGFSKADSHKVLGWWMKDFSKEEIT